jgi:hypothetical protein
MGERKRLWGWPTVFVGFLLGLFYDPEDGSDMFLVLLQN